ncbi:unnamed protein product [Caenorhabditis auriculariae]|uniref:Uncharacterized protein n=1 Tax=Caenorhabditis auriculariae TaxID=2777116 RepID=A0A8S1HA51_9PELO|nr:unnamed protein product [Caenorhabditis auriculariae]
MCVTKHHLTLHLTYWTTAPSLGSLSLMFYRGFPFAYTEQLRSFAFHALASSHPLDSFYGDSRQKQKEINSCAARKQKSKSSTTEKKWQDSGLLLLKPEIELDHQQQRVDTRLNNNNELTRTSTEKKGKMFHFDEEEMRPRHKNGVYR